MRKFIEEFKQFAIKGNVLDLAVGMIIGTAFTNIVKSVVNDIIMPFVGILIGGKDFTNLCLTIGEAKITYGMLIQNLVDFFIIAMFLFLVIKTLNRFKRKAEEVAEEPKKAEDVALLEEIKDLLTEINNK